MEPHKSTYEQIFFKKQVLHIPHDSWFVESQIWRVNFKLYTDFQLCGMSFPNPHVQGSNDHHSVCTLDLWET